MKSLISIKTYFLFGTLSFFAFLPQTIVGQDIDDSKISVSVYVEPQLLLFEYLSICDKFNPKWDKYNGSGEEFQFIPGTAFQIGSNLKYKIGKFNKLLVGIAYLHNQKYYAGYNDQATPRSLLTYKLDDYAANYFRIPVGVIINPLPNKRHHPVIGFFTNIDIMTYENVNYMLHNLHGTDTDSQHLMILDRVVPAISLGFENNKVKKFKFNFNLMYYFRSVYQHAHREFYFKNQSIGFNFIFTYKTKK
jgi:hypothetical protein